MKMLHSAVQLIPLASIDISDRVRDVDEAWAQAIAANIEEFGFQTPLLLRHKQDGRFWLVAGAHRRRAAEVLGWDEIPAVVLDLDDDQAGILEIDENLMRRELDKLDRMISLGKRKGIHERLHPETRHGGDRSSKSKNFSTCSKRFTAEVAEKVGLSERAVQLAIEVAAKLDPDAVKLLRGTSVANNQSILQKLSKEEPAIQRALALQFREGRATKLDGAYTAAGFNKFSPEGEGDDPQARAITALVKAWLVLDADHRNLAIREIIAVPKDRKAFVTAVNAVFDLEIK